MDSQMLYLRFLGGLLALLSLGSAACSKLQNNADQPAGKLQTNAYVSAVPFAAADDAADSFVALDAARSGIDFVNKVVQPEVLLDEVSAQAGLASADYDNDGDLDLFIAGIEVPNRLYRNEGNWKFLDVTEQAGAELGMTGEYSCAAGFADLDADGNLDLFVSTSGNGIRFFMGDGAGGFTDESGERGASPVGNCTGIAVLDLERDGDLDLYLATGRRGPGLHEQEFPADYADMFITNSDTGQRTMTGEAAGKYQYDIRNRPRLIPEADQFLVNDGQGHFLDAIGQTGINANSWSRSALAADFNGDGWTDLYLAGDMASPDRYCINNGNGTFTDEAARLLRRTPYYSHGADCGDINGDGRQDFFVSSNLAMDRGAVLLQYGDMSAWSAELANYQPQLNLRNCLYLNRGEGWMSELAEMAGLADSGCSWAVRIADLDCNTTPELFVSNGSVSRYAHDLDVRTQNSAMQAAGASAEELRQHALSFGTAPEMDLIFAATSPLNYRAAKDNWGISGEDLGGGALVQDFDGDGDLDIIVNRTNDTPAIWRNDLHCGNRLSIDLRQPSPNSQAVGATLKAFVGSKVLAAEVCLARGYASTESCRVHYGLGDFTQATRLEILWPDGQLQVEQSLAAGYHYVIQRRPEIQELQPPAAQTLYERRDFSWQRLEEDTAQDEYEMQARLPWQGSTLGGGMGIADFDLDGQLDIYFAGAAGQSGRLFLGNAGGFVSSQLMEGRIPPEVEEMSVLCFDANGDERPDMLISAGGVEAGRNTMLYRNWLVLNTEQGLLAGNISATETSSGSACCADIDRDGDLDLFIAGRLKPGSFMTAVESELLLNQSGTDFTDGRELLPGAGPITGVISDARFCDVDNDGWQDLLTCGEYGAVRLYRNIEGRFAAPLDLTAHGMWNSLAAADFDNDGDMDIVAGNLGLNTKYLAEPERAMALFAGDFSADGRRQLVEARQQSEAEYQLLPGCSYARQGLPPGVAERFPTWQSLAKASFTDLYGKPDELAEHYFANELSSMLLVNDGTGAFAAQALPVEAQYSIAFGIDAADYDNDGDLDLLMAGNFYATRPELGRWNAGYGQLLDGNGALGFTAMEPARSGIYVFEDSRGVQSLDTNGDGLLECLMSVAYSSPLTLRRQQDEQSGRGLQVSLVGRDGNRWATGSRLSLELDNGTVLTRDRPGGSGYQSSSLAAVHFGIPSGAAPIKLTVQWPDGGESSVTQFDETGLVTVLQY
jgi:hypothetical protein